jgi:hypothetical protein
MTFGAAFGILNVRECAIKGDVMRNSVQFFSSI